MSAASEDELLGLAHMVLERVSDREAEVIVVDTESALTRFAGNAIHQNVVESSRRVRLRLIAERKVGVAELRGGGEGVVPQLIAAAEQARRVVPEGAPSPLPRPAAPLDVGGVVFDTATASATPEMRSEAVGVVCDAARRQGVEAYGALNTTAVGMAVVNTTGVQQVARTTRAGLVIVVRGDDGAGYADRHSSSVEAIDVAASAEEAVDTCLRNQGAKATEPGTYEVVLSPYATAELLDHLSWMGFSALARQEQRSFLKSGEPLTSSEVTIDDDAADPARCPFPFDCEGVRTRPVTFIEAGVGRDVVHDTATALRDGVSSTGHALPMPNAIGPFPRHLAMAAGEHSPEELIAATDHGLYITRLWYVRHVHPLKTIITGMTREGTFRIEKGKLSSPVRDLRFTQSVIEALRDVRGISRERSLEMGEDGSGVLAPALHLGCFTFTS